MGKKSRGKGKFQQRQAARRSRTYLTFGITAGVIVLILAGLFFLGGPGGLGLKSARASPAPQWEAASIDGERFSSETFKGDVYVVDFFFMWCPICKAQFPHKKALVEEFAGREDFHFISIDADPSDSPERIQQYKTENGGTWPFVRDTYGLYQKFRVNSRPFIVFVDREGNISKIFTKITPAGVLITEAQRLLDQTTLDSNQTAVEEEASGTETTEDEWTRAPPDFLITGVSRRPSPGTLEPLWDPT